MAFGSILLLMVLLSLMAVHNLTGLRSDLDKVVNDNNVRMEYSNSMLNAIDEVRVRLRNVVLATDENDLREQQAKLNQEHETYERAHRALMATPSSQKGQVLRDQINAAAAVARPLNTQVLELGLANRNQEALALLLEKAAPATDVWIGLLEQLLQLQKQRNAQANQDSQAASQQALAWLIGGNLFGIALTVLLGVLVARSITGQLGGEPRTASELARSIARGDLSVKVELRPGDDSSMMAYFQLMTESLSRVVSQVRQNAESVASVSTQIAQGNSDLSQRTEEQASSLEETAASMEELGGAARQNADTVKQATELARSASDVAARGGRVVEQVIGTMKGINDASTQIADIINVIDGIAFQTNILALNAAVEAARAGEQGRGFAVVASEVRSLAQRSAGAAKEIKMLITTSVERVEQGSVLVDQAGTTMADVVTAIKRMTDLMAEVNVAINEQSASVTQVSDAVTAMDQVTQQNAALVEQSSAAAQRLKDQAQQMVQVVSVFKLS
ncbi:MAG: hypothetical protein RLZZ22_1781 [Pseudomonadota bacterium]|jgi:methyl-accepting chemotaxis protein